MRWFRAYYKKECMEAVRTSKLLIIMIIFFMFGIMNPAMAKLTPFLYEMMADSLKESGLIMQEVTVTAMQSWEQFYKNIPMALIAFVLIFAGIYATEYQKGTLVLAVSKGASKGSILLAKSVVLLGIWTIGYILCYATTYGYNMYFWDNSVASHCLYAALLYWVFGINIVCFMMLVSVLSSTMPGVLLGTGAYAAIMFFLNIIPKLSKYLPIKLTDGLSLIKTMTEIGDYTIALIITLITSFFYIVFAYITVNKKQF